MQNLPSGCTLTQSLCGLCDNDTREATICGGYMT